MPKGTASHEDHVHTAVTAPEAEAKGIETMTLEFGGHDYLIPATVDDWSIDALEAAEAGLPSRLLKDVLGPAQYAAFKVRHNTVKDLRALSDAIAAASGFAGALGN